MTTNVTPDINNPMVIKPEPLTKECQDFLRQEPYYDNREELKLPPIHANNEEELWILN